MLRPPGADVRALVVPDSAKASIAIGAVKAKNAKSITPPNSSPMSLTDNDVLQLSRYYLTTATASKATESYSTSTETRQNDGQAEYVVEQREHVVEALATREGR